MTDDTRRLLETSVAYLRLALREGGLPLDVPGPCLRVSGSFRIDNAQKLVTGPGRLFDLTASRDADGRITLCRS